MIMATANDFQKTAESVWNALDKLSEKNPEEYKRFIDKQLKEGAESLSPPQPAYCLTCSVTYKVNDTFYLNTVYTYIHTYMYMHHYLIYCLPSNYMLLHTYIYTIYV